jgi:hypothetical protein
LRLGQPQVRLINVSEPSQNVFFEKYYGRILGGLSKASGMNMDGSWKDSGGKDYGRILKGLY